MHVACRPSRLVSSAAWRKLRDALPSIGRPRSIGRRPSGARCHTHSLAWLLVGGPAAPECWLRTGEDALSEPTHWRGADGQAYMLLPLADGRVHVSVRRDRVLLSTALITLPLDVNSTVGALCGWCRRWHSPAVPSRGRAHMLSPRMTDRPAHRRWWSRARDATIAAVWLP